MSMTYSSDAYHPLHMCIHPWTLDSRVHVLIIGTYGKEDYCLLVTKLGLQ